MKQTELDYPYFDDKPVALDWLDWFIVLAALALGLAVLTDLPLPLEWMGSTADGLTRAILFFVIPLAALYWRTGGRIGVLFNGFRMSYLWWGLAFGALNLVFSLGGGALLLQVLDLASNETVAGLAKDGPAGGALVFFSRTGLQLFGEEVITILPFLFLLWLGVKKIGLSRRTSVVVAWIGSALIFGAIHLPTYDWNVFQALLVIGPVRLVLTLAYMKTRSIWTSTIAHVFNDWTMFIASIVLGSMAASAA
ncbi:lysostaphin resistance A-like protein [Dokdonella sp.]|uniref:CPBP family intramembrane glutamic endopeptidase n=1 Tax=Dokdonella sp. TaxID=2291710 RepID=UPI00352931C7